MTVYYKMRARDADCAALTYRTWNAVGSPDYAAVQYTGPKCGGSALVDVTVSSQYDDGGGSATSNLQSLTVPFTAPPTAGNWTVAAASSAGTTPSDVPGGVLFTAPNGGNILVATKTLASPGGPHTVTTFLSPQVQPASSVDVSACFGLVAMGSTQFFEFRAAFDSDATGILNIGSQRSNTSYFTASNLSFPWALYKGGYPFSASWWRMTFDNTTVTIERNQIGGGAVFPGQPNGNVGAWEALGTFTHGVGAIQSVGFSIRASANNAYPAALTLLSYVET